MVPGMEVLHQIPAGRKARGTAGKIQIMLVHDLVEIDAGDTYCYDDQGRQDQARREIQASDRIFNLLPADQARFFLTLWE